MIIRIAQLKLAVEGFSRAMLPPVYLKFLDRPPARARLQFIKSRDGPGPRLALGRRQGILRLARIGPERYRFRYVRSPGYGLADLSKRRFSYHAAAAERLPLNLIIETAYTFLLNDLKKEGAVFHACGVIASGRGYLFAARSGGGKSTMGRIALGSGRRLLNDDRVIVRVRRGRPWIFGNPWHGELTHVEARGTRLAKVFFLKKGRKNEVRRLGKTEAVLRLMSNAFLFSIDARARCRLFEKCVRLPELVPAFELTFVPNQDVWKVIERN